jgi:hypothetical protein
MICPKAKLVIVTVLLYGSGVWAQMHLAHEFNNNDLQRAPSFLEGVRMDNVNIRRGTKMGRN